MMNINSVHPSTLVYDIEIKKAIPEAKSPAIPEIDYCAGWQDFENMGIAVVGVYDYWTGSPRVFCSDNLPDFYTLCQTRKQLVGFNNIRFDNALLEANGYPLKKTQCYDILQAVWQAAGLGPEFDKTTHLGFGLEACSRANFNTGKTGYGGHAPILWQQGKIGQVIDYCLNDVMRTVDLLDRIAALGGLFDPRDARQFLPVLDLPRLTPRETV